MNKTARLIPNIVPSDAVAWHEGIASRFDSRYREGKRFKERLRVWSELIQRYCGPESNTVDLGCGSGVFTALLASRAERVYAIDGSAAMLGIARNLIGAQGARNVEIIESRLEAFLENRDAEFDLAVCSSVVEYLDRPAEFLDACRDALKDGAVLLVSMPNGASWYRALEARIFALAGFPGYYRYVKSMVSPEAWIEYLSRAGFDIVEYRYYGSAPVFSWLMRSMGLTQYSDTMIVFAARKRGPAAANA